MRIDRTILALLLAFAPLPAVGARAAAPAPPENPGTDGTDAPETPAGAVRVILRVDRHTTVKGTVEMEDDDVIVVRTQRNELLTFGKPRIAQLVRLGEAGDGRPGTVVLRNGEQRSGTIIEDGFDYVIVEIKGVRARFRRESVDHVRFDPTLEERYEHFKATGGHRVPQRHLSMCRWLVDERRYDLAEIELADLLRRTDLPEAERLLRLVRAQRTLQREAAARASAPTTRPDGDPTAADGPGTATPEVARPRPVPDELVTSADVNLLRVYEIDFRRPPKVVVRSETIDRLIRSYSASPLLPPTAEERAALHKAEPVSILRLLFELRARELYPEVEVRTEPYALNVFRQRVHNTWLMNNCATSRCHGGEGAGRFFLHRRDFRDERVRTTNLLILERLELDPEWPLVNYARPIDSLIIQHGLPANIARRPHPAVRGWRPAFRRLDDRMVEDTVHWLESMLKPRPEYPITYTPPNAGIAPFDDRDDR